MKICSKCKEEKALGEFPKGSYVKKDGTRSLNSWCKSCRNEYQKKYSYRQKRYVERNKGKISARMKCAYDSNPEAYREKTRKWREENKDKMKAYHDKWHGNRDRFEVALQCSRKSARNNGYEPCSATAEELRVAFTGRCFICGVPELECSTKLVVDHSHEDGYFRGWLCRKCNSALGFFGDNEELFIDALHYLMNCRVK